MARQGVLIVGQVLTHSSPRDCTAQGDNLQTLIPHERWAIEPVFAPDVAVDKMYVRFGGFLPGVDLFDAAAFRWVEVRIAST